MKETDLFEGQSLRVTSLTDGVFELCFDRRGESINKLDDRTMGELREAVSRLGRERHLRGVLVTSAKDVFVVGADITEFGAIYSQPADAIAAYVARGNEIFNALEDLPAPTVAAINGFALGGGLELALCASQRVMSTTARVGLPEVKLGIFPGYGGTVRLTRIAGPALACRWVAGGLPAGAQAALAAGVVDAIAAPDGLRAAALDRIASATSGRVDWRASQQRKRTPVALSPTECAEAFAAARQELGRSPPHQPAAEMALEMMEKGALLDRAGALVLENRAFGAVARTQAASSLIRIFLNEQALRKQRKSLAKQGSPVRSAAVLGTHVRGLDIAALSAVRGIAVRIVDADEHALVSAMAELDRRFAREVQAGRLTQQKVDAASGFITTQSAAQGLGDADIAIDSGVDDPSSEQQQQRLRALEPALAAGAVIATSTSTLGIDRLASCLERRGSFIGLHFFEPVLTMPLVEVVRGSCTEEAALGTAVGYVLALEKHPVVVKDCPGYLVNRILVAYLRGFLRLLAEGAGFVEVDRAMEAFGWPIGPAAVADAMGLDVVIELNDAVSAGYPDRMPPLESDAFRLMVRAGRHGRACGSGFYRYDADGKRGEAADAHAIPASQPQGERSFDAAEIVDRMMLPTIVESAHALAEGVVSSAAELDTAVLLGLNFPAYAGGPLKYADWLGLAEVVIRCDRYRRLGPMYEATPAMREMARSNARFHPL